MNLRPIWRGLVALGLVLLPALAQAQGIPAFQTGTLTPNHLLKGAGNGQHMDVGGLTGDVNGRGASPFSITDNLGLGLCTHSGVTGGQHYEFCLGHDSSGNALLSLTANGGALEKSLYLSKNGVLYEMPFVGAGGGNVVGPASSTVDNCALWNNTAGTALKTGNCVVGASTTRAGDLAIWDNATGSLMKGSSGLFRVEPEAMSLGYVSETVQSTAIQRLSMRNRYNGTDAAAGSLFANLDLKAPVSGAYNASSIYGTMWFNSAVSYTGLSAAGRFNTYTIPQLTASVGSAGSGYTNGDIVTVSGGTCNTMLNTPPQFTLTVSGGVVTGATYYYLGAGACSVYPGNPVTMTGGTGTGLTLNISNGSVDVNYLVGLYGRSRQTAAGTVGSAISLFADGAYNTGGGTQTKAVGLWLQPPYDTNRTDSYGIWVATNLGSFSSGVIGSEAGVDLTLNPGVGGIVSTTREMVSGIGQPCRANLLGGSNAQFKSLGTDCYTWVVAQGTGAVVLASDGLAAAQFSTAASSVNYVDVSGAITASAPIIGVGGGDTNISLRLNAKGTGSVIAGTATAGSFGLLYASSAAAVPANFAANRYIQITANGVTVYVPAMLASW